MVKRITIVLLIILGVFISFSLYRTYAYNTTVVEDTPSTTDLEYTFKIGDSSIKEITISSSETKYYDIVLGNPNNAKISYSIYYEMVSPNTKPDNFSIEYTSKSTGDSTGKVDKNSNITLNLVVTNTSSSSVTVKLGSIAGYVNGGELLLGSGQVVIPKRLLPATSIIEALDDGTTGDSGSGVYKVTHDAIAASNSATGSEIPASTDYRYYGASPNNYICLDMEGGSTCPDKHLYRIIGSIYEENAGQNLPKVIKATELTDGTNSGFAWNCSGSPSRTKLMASPSKDTCPNGRNNDWSGSTLRYLLNYVWFDGQSDTFYNSQDMDNEYIVDFSNYSLSDKAKALINEKSLFYLSGYSTTSINVANIYLMERGLSVSSGNSKYWNGKIGLMYSSDYGYASGFSCIRSVELNNYNSQCINKNWIDSSDVMTITASSSNSIYTYRIRGGVLIDLAAAIGGGVYPVFYLSKDVVITSGTGSLADPYQVTK